MIPVHERLAGDDRRTLWDGPVVDTDVHVMIPDMEALIPFLPNVWVQHVREQQWVGPSSNMMYPPAMPWTTRPEWRREDGRRVGSSLEMLQADLLDPWKLDAAILICLLSVDGGPPDFSAALAAAANDWLAAEWLARDARLRASIVLPGPNDPAAMAAEIDRVGGNPGFVQATLPARSGRLYGKRLFWPVFEALERNSIVAGLHPGGSNDGLPTTPAGWPSWYAEEYSGEVQVFESQLISLLAEGVFQKFPGIRVSFLESGFTWVPMWMWNLDRNWKGIRREVPWLDRRPFEVVRDHVRFSTAPIDAFEASQLAKIIEWLGSDELLMFATDYPHWHNDDLAVLLKATPEISRTKLMSGNARAWYRLDAEVAS